MTSRRLLGMLEALSRKPEELPPLTLAYIGDAVQELFVRHYLVASGEIRPRRLQQSAIRYVSASAQAQAIGQLMSKLTEEEIAVFKRGRNAKSTSISRRTDIAEYRQGTGLEALLGYLYLSGQEARLIEMMEILMKFGPLGKGAGE